MQTNACISCSTSCCALSRSAAPFQAAYGSAISIQDASGLAAAHPHLRLTCTHGPGRSFADRRGTTLRLKHRLQLRDGASKKMTRTCHQDDARTATGHLREDSSCCRRVGAVVLPNHPRSSSQPVRPCSKKLRDHVLSTRRTGVAAGSAIRALFEREPISQSRARRRLILRCNVLPQGRRGDVHT